MQEHLRLFTAFMQDCMSNAYAYGTRRNADYEVVYPLWCDLHRLFILWLH